jgi:hypothetical protein
MSEVEVSAAPVASEPVVTATPDTEVVQPVVETPVVPAKTFSQEELDSMIGKRLARERRQWEREHQAAVVPPPPVEVPPVDQFPSVEAYAEAVVEKTIQQREELRRQSEVVEQYHEREESARAKYDDFDQVAYNPQLRITQTMAQTIQLSEMGADVAYYLGTNPKEAERIAKLQPFLQAKEIGKIEVQIASNPPIKKTSSAPAPFTPVSTGGGTSSPSYDTTDPRSIKTMTTTEWINAERKRQEKKWQAQNR